MRGAFMSAEGPPASPTQLKVPALEQMIGYASIERRFESLYSFVARIIRANQLTEAEVRSAIPDVLLTAAFAVDGRDRSEASAWLEARGVPEAAIRARLGVEAWEPLPGFNSVAPEHLRICPACFTNKFHSFAWHCDTVARCPLHAVPLTQACPNCATPLLRRGASPRKSAFTCPRNCVLEGDKFKGLGGAQGEPGAAELARQLDWAQGIRQRIRVVAGPAHVALPPYLAVTTLRMPPLPSMGLATSVVASVLGTAETTFAWHDPPSPTWSVDVVDFVAPAAPPTEAFLDHVRRSIRRTSYRTHLPIVDLAEFRAWFDRTPQVQPWIELEKLVMVSGEVVSIPVPSHLLTANEINGLRMLLSRDYAPAVCAGMYTAVLFEVIENAVDRRLQLDGKRCAGSAVRAAERVDALLEVDGVHRRLKAHTYASGETLTLWRGYQEPAELGGGYIYVGDPRDRWH